MLNEYGWLFCRSGLRFGWFFCGGFLGGVFGESGCSGWGFGWFSFWGGSSEEGGPVKVWLGWILGPLDGELRYGIDDPLEVDCAYGVKVGVGGWIHEVDGVGDAVGYAELYGVEVVAEGAAKSEGVFFYSGLKFL